MLTIKQTTKLSWLAGAALLLQGCGDSYPEMGKFQGNKNISKHSTIYTLNPASFDEWKKERLSLEDLSKLSESDLLSLQQKYANTAIIQKAFGSKTLLADQSLDLDALTQQELNKNAEKSEQYKAKLANIENLVAEIKAKKEKSDAAEAELEKIKSDINALDQKLLKQRNDLTDQSAKIFQKFNDKEVGSRQKTLQSVALGKPFGYENYQVSSGKSCHDYIVGRANGYGIARKKTYIYAPFVKIGRNAYCPIFKTPGGSTKASKAVLAKLTEDEKSLLRKTATARLTFKYKTRQLSTEKNNVNRNHPELYNASKAFGYREKQELIRLAAATQQGEKLIADLAKITEEDIKAKKLKELKVLLAQSNEYYLLESLQNRMEKESIIQPDGTFTLKSGKDFYLVEVDVSNKTNPSATQYALIRMEQFKNKELVNLSGNEFFAFSSLTNISL